MNPYTLDDIARYAEGEMTAEELQAFEQALATDESLRQQLAFYRDVHDSLQQHFTKDAARQNWKTLCNKCAVNISLKSRRWFLSTAI